MRYSTPRNCAFPACEISAVDCSLGLVIFCLLRVGEGTYALCRTVELIGLRWNDCSKQVFTLLQSNLDSTCVHHDSWETAEEEIRTALAGTVIAEDSKSI